MSIENTINLIEEYNELFESEKHKMSDIEKALFSPSSLNLAKTILNEFKQEDMGA